ncbi:hypothetical protein [Chryseobacterium sp. Leaf394]|uniref:hypothetical protein n=1 Tax=Chryseobacterium sp. Leaf394 TaxID=1736361 RepID=UPI0006F92187|nr:hypothetical protein [Chryseobacterium sp. Leaf394]KQS93080.1 hypothetical protein ASG21_11810 [Chryseobacterium sp. Leaf394]
MSNQSFRKNNNDFETNTFDGDSGYVSIKSGENLLLELNKNDIIDFEYKQLKQSDTIGKYYRKLNSTNFILYLNDITNKKLSPSNFIIEVDSKGKIIKSERYVNGFYLCCWNNKFDGFGKINDYFFIKSCGTGSAFCSAQLYFFKDVTPQENLNPIIKSLFHGMCETNGKKWWACSLESTFKTAKDSIIFNYEYKTGISKKRKKYKKIEKFDVVYRLKNNVWVASDTTRINQIQY